MTTQPKFCRDCRHYVSGSMHWCNRVAPTFDLVTGGKEPNPLDAREERNPYHPADDKCGPDGKYWEPKPVKVPWWQYVFGFLTYTNQGKGPP